MAYTTGQGAAAYQSNQSSQTSTQAQQDKAAQYGLVYANGGYFQPGANTGSGGGMTEQGLNQYIASQTASQGVQQTSQVAAGTTAPGQSTYDQQMAALPGQGTDVFSQKLAQMSTGQFAPDDPSYQWRLQQGQQAVERSGAAKGMLGSGNILTALTDYGQGAASSEYGAQFSRMLQGSQNASGQQTTQFNEMLAGSQNATGQYSAAYNALSTMLGQGTSMGNMMTGQAAQGVQAQQVGFNQKTASNSSQGAQDMLSQLMNPNSQYQDLTGQSYWANQEAITARETAQAGQNYSTPMSGYKSPSSSYYPSDPNMGSGQGWFSNSSGGGGTFGDYSSANGFGGGE